MEKNMKKRRARLLAAVLTLAALFAAGLQTPAWADGINLDHPCGVTFLPAGESSGFLTDLRENADVVVDLYKVADAERVDDNDTYTLSLRAAFTGLTGAGTVLNSSTATNADWQALAAAAFAAVQAKAGTDAAVTPTAAGAAVDTAIALSGEGLETLGGPGLYLVIARGGDLTAAEDYTKTIRDDAGHEKQVTIANSELYRYEYEPQLIAIPTKAAVAVLDENGQPTGETQINTLNPGDWIYSPVISLKPQRVYRMGDLEIAKTLEGYIGTEPAAFVFTVEAEWPDLNDNTKTEKYSNTHTLFFSTDGTQSYKIEQKIPVGVEVTVKEVYSGSHYTLNFTDQEKTVTIGAESAARAAFTNVFNETVIGGYGVENEFEHDGSTWRWVQRRTAG